MLNGCKQRARAIPLPVLAFSHAAFLTSAASSAAIACADAVAFGPADHGHRERYADLLTSAVLGLRKSLGGDGDRGSDVFVPSGGSRLPQQLLPEFGPEQS